jgi:HJR/Mrr/RecB family endonuclease
MNPKDISKAKDPDLRSAMAALLRASVLARKAAMDTGTDLVVVKDGKLMFVQVKTQHEQARAEDAVAK